MPPTRQSDPIEPKKEEQLQGQALDSLRDVQAEVHTPHNKGHVPQADYHDHVKRSRGEGIDEKEAKESSQVPPPQPNLLQTCSEELYREVEKTKSSGISLDVVQRCVSGGADLLFWPEGKECPILHLCIANGHVEVLKRLLETPRLVDFTVADKSVNHSTPLHCVAGSGRVFIPVRKAMLTAILNRLSTHPNDKVDWSAKDVNGYDFLSYTAWCGLLGDLYPMVKGQPYYKAATKPIVLSYGPCDDDWHTLSPSERMDLQRPCEEQ